MADKMHGLILIYFILNEKFMKKAFLVFEIMRINQKSGQK